MTGTTNPVPATLTIGDDAGTTSSGAVFTARARGSSMPAHPRSRGETHNEEIFALFAKRYPEADARYMTVNRKPQRCERA